MFRRFGILIAGLATIPACTQTSSTSATNVTTPGAPVVQADVGLPLYAGEKPEVIPPPEAVQQSIVIPNAVVRMDRKQTVAAQVEGTLEVIGVMLQPGTKVDPNDKDIFFDPNDKEKQLPYKRLRIGNIVTKGQTVALLNDLEALVQIEAARKIIVSSTKAIAAATEGRDKIQESLMILRKVGAAASAVELIQAEATLARYNENIFQSEREMAKAEGDEKRANVLRVKHRSNAAVTGIITNITAEPGEYVKAGQPLMEILSLEDVRIEGMMEAHYANSVRPGMQVTIEPTQPIGPDMKAGSISHRQEVTGVAVTSGARPIVVSSSLDGTAVVWDVKGAAGTRSHWQLPHPTGVRSVAVTGPVVSKAVAATGCDDGHIRLWDISAPERLSDKPMSDFSETHSGGVTAICFSPDGRHLASASGREVFIWNVADGKKLYSLPSDHKDAVTMVKFTPQGKLVTASRDKAVRVWTIGTTGANLDRTIDHRKGNVEMLGVSNKGGRVLFDLDDGKLEIVSLADGQPVGSIQNAATGARFSTLAIFSPDDSFVITAGGDGDMRGELQVWEAPKPGSRGAELRRLVTPFRSMPTCAAFGGEVGKGFVVIGTQAGGVHYWSGDMLKSMSQGRTGRVISVLRADQRNVRIRVETNALGGEMGMLQDKSTATLIIHPSDQPAAPASLPGNAMLTVPPVIIPAGGIVVPGTSK